MLFVTVRKCDVVRDGEDPNFAIVNGSDDNADGIIDPNEAAYFMFGFGRGGRGYYRIPVSRFSGTLDATINPIQPLLYEAGTTTEGLQETWAAPSVGKIASGRSFSMILATTSGVIGST